MADETTDISNHEQVVIVICWITKDLIVHEEFIGLYEVACTGSATITAAIVNVLTRLNLSLSKVCGQCYNGASSMSGSRSGVAKRITDLEPGLFSPTVTAIHLIQQQMTLSSNQS